MELEYLKEVWKKAGEDNVMSVAGKQRLLPLPGAPSQSLVSKMRRNLFYELLIVLVCVAAIAVFYFVSFGGALKEVSWAYILLAFIFTVYFYKKNKIKHNEELI